MPVLPRVILACVLLLAPSSSAYPAASSDKREPVAQVYDVQGRAAIRGFAAGPDREVRKGCLIGRDDSLILDKGSSVGLYFKSGGRKDIRALDAQSVYKAADLLPRTEAYGQTVPLFGAVRGPVPGEAAHPAGFFYPQETVVLENPPVIEFSVFDNSGEAAAPAGAVVEISKESALVGSGKFDNLAFGSPYAYQCPQLKGGVQYIAEVKLDLKQTIGSVLAVSFPLYIAEAAHPSSIAAYKPFADSFYRSFESTSVEYNGKKYSVSLIKQMAPGGDPRRPVISIEFFIENAPKI